MIETGKGLKFQAERPHLVSLGSGRLSVAITLLPLPEGEYFALPHFYNIKFLLLHNTLVSYIEWKARFHLTVLFLSVFAGRFLHV